MGVKHSKQSVDISAPPKKNGELNGKAQIEEVKTEDKTLLNGNGEVDKPLSNGDSNIVSNGDLHEKPKSELIEDQKESEPEKGIKENDEAKEANGEANGEAKEVEGEEEKLPEEEKKKSSTKDKIKKKLSMRSFSFLKKKVPKDAAAATTETPDAEKAETETAEKPIEEVKAEEEAKTEEKPSEGEKPAEDKPVEDKPEEDKPVEDKPEEKSDESKPETEEIAEPEQKTVEASAATVEEDKKTEE